MPRTSHDRLILRLLRRGPATPHRVAAFGVSIVAAEPDAYGLQSARSSGRSRSAARPGPAHHSAAFALLRQPPPAISATYSLRACTRSIDPGGDPLIVPFRMLTCMCKMDTRRWTTRRWASRCGRGLCNLSVRERDCLCGRSASKTKSVSMRAMLTALIAAKMMIAAH